MDSSCLGHYPGRLERTALLDAVLCECGRINLDGYIANGDIAKKNIL